MKSVFSWRNPHSSSVNRITPAHLMRLDKDILSGCAPRAVVVQWCGTPLWSFRVGQCGEWFLSGSLDFALLLLRMRCLKLMHAPGAQSIGWCAPHMMGAEPSVSENFAKNALFHCLDPLCFIYEKIFEKFTSVGKRVVGPCFPCYCCL